MGNMGNMGITVGAVRGEGRDGIRMEGEGGG